MPVRTEACKKCGATIFFMKTDKGNWMPLDAKPERKYIMVTKEMPDPMGFGMTSMQILESVAAYTPHWATCPFADEFRKEEKTEVES